MSARFLEEFVVIVNSAAASVSEIEDDLRELVPTAEAALTEMNDAIARISTGAGQESRQDMEPSILAQVTAAIASEKPQSSASASDVTKEPQVVAAAALDIKQEEIETEGVAV
ncbi:MAG: hypothetical protein MN733_13725 [Nitrososphaera sp.]|nr:hypothetical protein [Nitrososphaera sp.]